MKRSFLLVIAVLIIILLLIILWPYFRSDKEQNPAPKQRVESITEIEEASFALPIEEFGPRITKKPFGIFTTPENSPVSPEHFTGYHTGVDVEYGDVASDVPVYAVLDGRITVSRQAQGYGGIFVMESRIEDSSHSILYGHIRPGTLPEVGQNFSKGEKIALLGNGNTEETDGERKHLHFAVLSDNRIDLRGYVQRENELAGWIDPLVFYPEEDLP